MSNSTFNTEEMVESPVIPVKTFLQFIFLFLISINYAFSQCENFSQKIESPVCSKPTDAKVVSASCDQLLVQWQGSIGQTYEVLGTFKDPATNNTIENVVTSGISCDNNFNCTATIPVSEGAKVTWSVQAICANGDRTFYSYLLRGNKDYPIPSCKELSEDPINSLHVYPSPSTGNISVEYTGSITGNVQFIVYNAMGKIVFSEVESANKSIGNIFQFHLSDLPPGIYTMEERNGSEVSRTKFVLLH